MRNKVLIGSLLVLALSWVMPAAAMSHEDDEDKKISFAGEIRGRYEYLDNYTNANSDATDRISGFPYRVRFGMRGEVANNVHAYVEVQNFGHFGNDSPVRGLPDPILQNVSTQSNSGLDLYQGLFWMKEIGGSKFDLGFGRMEHRQNNEVHLGDNDFYNGFSFDGGRGMYNAERWSIDLYAYLLRDANFSGLPGTITEFAENATHYGGDFEYRIGGDKTHRARAYLMFTKNRSGVTGIGGTAVPLTGLDLYTFGLSWTKDMRDERGLDWSAELAFQSGDFDSVITPGNKTDHSGTLFEGWIGYRFGNAGRIRLGAFYTSGTKAGDVAAGGDYKTFVGLFPDIHEDNRLGDLDLFGGTIMSGPSANIVHSAGGILPWGSGFGNVTNLNLRYQYPTGKHDFKAALHWFQATEDVLTLSGTLQNDIGIELDLSYGFQYSKHLTWQVGLATLAPGDLVKAQSAVLAANQKDDMISRFWLQGRMRF